MEIGKSLQPYEKYKHLPHSPIFNPKPEKMYRGYKLSLNKALSTEINECYSIGLPNHQAHQEEINDKLRSFNSDGVLDGEMLEDEWFPQVDAEVFISHSHKDERLAISLAGWLYSNFGITSFVDSAVWGNGDELQREVDKLAYKPISRTYDYDIRNQTTAHIHMMLNAAIMKMMDKTECFFLINTPNSIFKEGLAEVTYSPWIYSELSLSKLLRINEPPRPLMESQREFAKGGDVLMKANVKMKHKADSRHLEELNYSALMRWKGMAENFDSWNALDTLYCNDQLIKSGIRRFSE